MERLYSCRNTIRARGIRARRHNFAPVRSLVPEENFVLRARVFAGMSAVAQGAFMKSRASAWLSNTNQTSRNWPR